MNQTTEKVAAHLNEGKTKAEIARLLNIQASSVTYHCKKLNIVEPNEKKDWVAIQQYHDLGHTLRECQQKFGFSRQTWHKAKIRGDIKPRNTKIPLVKILQIDTQIASSKLKKRLLEEGMLKNVCSECDQKPWWNGKILVLELDHINGNPKDNRIENLRILCGHCHSQTSTFCRGHKKNISE